MRRNNVSIIFTLLTIWLMLFLILVYVDKVEAKVRGGITNECIYYGNANNTSNIIGGVSSDIAIAQLVSEKDVRKRNATYNDTCVDEGIEGEYNSIKDIQRAYEERFERYFGYVPTDAELNLFYRTVMAECGYTEPDEGVRAVCDVIANRVISPRFPDTLAGVLFQRNQFETVATGKIYNYEVTDRVRGICDEQIRNGVSYEGLLFFTAGGYNEYCTPAYRIGNHYFGY